MPAQSIPGLIPYYLSSLVGPPVRHAHTTPTTRVRVEALSPPPQPRSNISTTAHLSLGATPGSSFPLPYPIFNIRPSISRNGSVSISSRRHDINGSAVTNLPVSTLQYHIRGTLLYRGRRLSPGGGRFARGLALMSPPLPLLDPLTTSITYIVAVGASSRSHGGRASPPPRCRAGAGGILSPLQNVEGV